MSESGSSLIRVLLVEDHQVVREGLELILSQCADIIVAGSAASGEEALELVVKLSVDLVLLDLSLPGMHGLDVIPALIGQGSAAPRVLVLTVLSDDDIVLKAVQAGAQGYILKSTSGDELVRAIRRVAAGEEYFDAVVVRAFMNRDKLDLLRKDTLTSRELSVLRLVAAGKTNRQIGTELFLSAETVKAHLENIFRKLEASDRTHAVAVAMRQGLLD
jgi:two-component system, NarL family, response regulator